MKIIVAGASGFVGSTLIPLLRARGHTVRVMVRRPAGDASEIEWQPGLRPLDASAFAGVDGVVNLAGASIASGPWTSKRRALLRSSRLKSTAALVAAMTAASPSVFVNASAIGYYGDRGDEILTEASSPGRGFLSELCMDWEREAQTATAKGVRVVCLRIGMVLGARGGALPRMKEACRFGVVPPLGDDAAWLSWISGYDLARLIVFSLENSGVRGPVNAVAPNPVSHAGFAAALATLVGRKPWLRIPQGLIRVFLGDLAKELLFASQRVSPEALHRHGFRYERSALSEALAGNS